MKKSSFILLILISFAGLSQVSSPDSLSVGGTTYMDSVFVRNDSLVFRLTSGREYVIPRITTGGGATPPGEGQIFYVSTSGNDITGNGTQAYPWKTLAYAESQATTAGDTIALKRGDTWTISSRLVITHGGTFGNEIIWDGSLWGTGAKAIIQADAGMDDYMVNIRACNYLTFQNITIDGNEEQVYGIVIGGHAGQNNENCITIRNDSILDCGDNTGYNISLLVQPMLTDMDSIRVDSCYIDGATNHGICFYPLRNDLGGNSSQTTNSYIGYNTVTNCGLKGDGVGSYILAVANHDSLIIEHNTITEGSGSIFGIAVIGSVDGSPQKVHVRYNDVRMNTSAAFWSQNGGNTEAHIYYNLFYSAARPTGHAVVEFSTANYTGVFNFWNNTIVGDGNTGQGFLNDGTTASMCDFKNNIVIQTGTGDNCLFNQSTSGTTTHSYNAYYRTASGDPRYASNAGTPYLRSTISTYEPTAVIDPSPLLVDRTGFDWHLQDGSPCINAGINIPTIPQFDFDGVAVSDPPEIGAYEK